MSINPFGKKASQRTAVEVLPENFGIGIHEYDRGADIWDENRIDEKTGEVSPGWVHQENKSHECVIMFSVNEGRGTGRQIIPANEFRDYVASLKSIIKSGYKEPEAIDRTRYYPTNEIALKSFKMTYPRVRNEDGNLVTDKSADRDVVSVRCTGGKGSKPMLVPKEEFPAVVSMLEKIADDLDDYEKKAWDNYNADQSSDS